MINPYQVVQVDDHSKRAYELYPEGAEPYDTSTDMLTQKLWSVVNAELGPGAADILTNKLHVAVLDHVAKGGTRR